MRKFVSIFLSLCVMCGMVSTAGAAYTDLNSDNAEIESVDATVAVIKTSENGIQKYTLALDEKDVDKLLYQKCQADIDNVIAHAKASNTFNLSTVNATSGRPTYTYTYGRTYYVKSPFKKVAGQPTNGYRLSTGGTVSIEPSGGPTFSFSYNFPYPFNSIGIAMTPGKIVSYATTINIRIPASATHHYLAYLSNTYKCQPYIVYKVVNGSKSVYYKGASSVWYQADAEMRQVD